MPKLQFIVFLLVVLSIYAAMHGFVYWRLASGLSLSSTQRLVLAIIIIAGALSFVFAELINHLAHFRPLLFAGSLWFGVIAIAFSVFLVELPLSLVLPHSRRLLTLAALAIVFSISAFSLANVALGPVVREKRVPLPNLPTALNGFTIVQLSDLHLGNLSSMAGLRRIVARVNELKPDLICVSGDTIDGEIGRDGRYGKALRDLKARHGVVAVTGNHEFYAGIDRFLDLARRANWRVLRNESLIITGRLVVAGLEEDAAARLRLPGPDLDKALRGVAPEMTTVLLYHRPKLFAEAVRRGVDLQLSGHTHAGQIPPMDLLVYLTYKYSAGLYRLGDSFIHTTTGTGTWGPPMRFLSRSEIVKLILVAE